MKVILTGSTGMVGEAVLHYCLQSNDVSKVLVVNRRSCGVEHPKLEEIIHGDLFNLVPIEEKLRGYDACLFCLGITSVGMKKEDYYRTTYTLTMHFGETLSRLNRGMTFCYISGAGTDSTEKGSTNWARVKGKTENDLMKLPLKDVYAFRPAFIKPMEGMKRTHSFYKYINWIFPIGRRIYPKAFCTMEELAEAMIQVSKSGYKNNIIEGDDIIAIAGN